MKNQIEKINQMNLEVITLINQVTSKPPRLVKSIGVKIKFVGIEGIQEIEIPTSLEDIASGKTDVDL